MFRNVGGGFKDVSRCVVCQAAFMSGISREAFHPPSVILYFPFPSHTAPSQTDISPSVSALFPVKAPSTDLLVKPDLIAVGEGEEGGV